MKHFNQLQKFLLRPSLWLVLFPLLLIVPNVALCITEQLQPVVSAANILLPLGIYLLILTSTKKIGISTYLLFPFLFFAAFQIVLLFLFGNSIIAIDMFQNLYTTNPGEASELLDNLGGSMLAVGILYIPPLIWGAYAIIKRIHTPQNALTTGRMAAACTTTAGLLCLGASFAFVPKFAVDEDIFPYNVLCNFVTSISRTQRIKHYYETAADYRFNASPTHPPKQRELYILIIGETMRARNCQLTGYNRTTTPHLSAQRGIIAFPRALTESNTTHKSVPMLMSTLTAENFDSIYYTKSVISAFKEAGFNTAFLSMQKRNRSFIEFFGNEADYVEFISENSYMGEPRYDESLVDALTEVLSAKADKQLIILHSYGSHFCYRDRYPRSQNAFHPDNANEASPAMRKELINAYDNTIKYTDSWISSLIDGVSRLTDTDCAIIYSSDHGEDIFDDNRELFLHASPIPSYWQLHVPMFLWMSDCYRQHYPEKYENAIANRGLNVSTSESVAHTLLDIAGINTPRSNVNKAVTAATYTEPIRRYLTDRNQAVTLEDAGLQQEDFAELKQQGIR